LSSASKYVKPGRVKTAISFLVATLLLTNGCAFKRFAINQVGNALAGSGGTFASDDDPELIRQAVPFGLKLQESLLAESPRHRGLLLANTSGFTQYSFAFVLQDADELEAKDLVAADALRDRARKLFFRARDYGLRGLEVAHGGFGRVLREEPPKAVRRTTRHDVPLLYWTAAAWGAAISISKDQPDVIADLPKMAALIDRALELNEQYDNGAIHTFLISYEMARPGAKAEVAAARAKAHFERAIALTGGLSAGPFVSFAEGVCVQRQNREEFESLLNRALAIDVARRPEWRLANLVMQRRARWLLARADDLFVDAATKSDAPNGP
jgi:predicted anti-sigma-YlaC factor YlaD